jgi:hypothetical protein
MTYRECINHALFGFLMGALRALAIFPAGIKIIHESLPYLRIFIAAEIRT